MFTLNAQKRDTKTPEALRKEGLVPAVYYGNKKPATSIAVISKDFKKIWKEAGESSTILLTTPEGKVDVLIHEVQADPVTGNAQHIDFLVVDMNKEIEVNLPIEFIGDAPATKSGVGAVVKSLHELQVSALPKDMPHSIEVDISGLANLDDHILVKDIKIPKGLTIISGLDEVVASVTHIKEEVEEVAPVDLSAIEVEKKGKTDEEGATEEQA